MALDDQQIMCSSCTWMIIYWLHWIENRFSDCNVAILKKIELMRGSNIPPVTFLCDSLTMRKKSYFAAIQLVEQVCVVEVA